MIQICTGTTEAIYFYISTTYTTNNDIVIKGSDEFALPFLLIRTVIPLVKERLGEKIVQAVLEDYQLLTTILYKDENHPDIDRKHYDRVTASLSSNITHSRVAKDTLIRESSEILHKLLSAHQLRLVIPDIRQLDTGSVDVLRHLYHVSSDIAPAVVIGYDPNWGETIFEEEIGVSWYRSVDSVTVFQAFINSFKAKATDIKILENKAVVATKSPLAFVLKLDNEDEALEWIVFQKVQSLPKKIRAAEALQIFIAIEKCFRLFDFTNALLLSLQTVEIIESHLSDIQKGKLYHIIGLSAHNRHFFSQQNDPLAHFLWDIFKKALQYEKDPSRKTAILYRLIVTVSRRLNKVALAFEYVDQAYKELNISNFKEYDQPILTAWINNIHSFLLMKEKQIEAAIEMQAKGFYLLERLKDISVKEIEIEIAYTKAVLAENLATLNSITENVEAMEFWYAKEVAFTQQWPSLNATSFAEWQSFYFQNLQLTQALQKTEQGLINSKDSFNYILEYFFTLSAADINYRLGNSQKSITYFERAIAMQSQIDHSYISSHILQLSIIKSQIQLGGYDIAIQQLTEIHLDKEPIESTIEIQSLLAFCHAKKNATATAEKHINTAIDLAMQSAEASLLFNVCISGGMIAQELHNEEAVGFYKKALEIADVTIEGNSFQPNSGNMVRLYMGLFQLENQHISWLFLAIDHLKNSLKKHADSWQELKSMLTMLLSLPATTQKQLFLEKQEAIQKIMKAAAQRNDCEDELFALSKISTAHLNI